MAAVVSLFALFITCLFVFGIFSFASFKNDINVDHYMQENVLTQGNYEIVDDTADLKEEDLALAYEQDTDRYVDLKKLY